MDIVYNDNVYGQSKEITRQGSHQSSNFWKRRNSEQNLLSDKVGSTQFSNYNLIIMKPIHDNTTKQNYSQKNNRYNSIDKLPLK